MNVGDSVTIIPYQELLGNYNPDKEQVERLFIIPYQALLGNYNGFWS